MGSLIGAAVGDALGAPCECMHYKRILKEYGDFKSFEDLVAVKAGWSPLGAITDGAPINRLNLMHWIEPDATVPRGRYGGSPDIYDVIWETPSKDHNGSLPQ